MKESEIKDCRILIKNLRNGQIIADTNIIRSDRRTNSVFISADSLKEKKYYNISAFIFARDSLYEFYGTIKGVLVDNEIEVLLGKSRRKENRAKTRYPVVLEGDIDVIMIDDQMINLRKAIRIRTLNMSANGILMQADPGCFEIGDCFSLTLRVDKKNILLACEVVRLQNSGMLTEEYGCRIDEIWIENDEGE